MWKNRLILRGFACTTRTQFLALQQDNSMPVHIFSAQIPQCLQNLPQLSVSAGIEVLGQHRREPTSLRGKPCWRTGITGGRNLFRLHLQLLCVVQPKTQWQLQTKEVNRGQTSRLWKEKYWTGYKGASHFHSLLKAAYTTMYICFLYFYFFVFDRCFCIPPPCH